MSLKNKMLGCQQTAKILKKAPATCRKAAERGQIPAIKFGDRWYFSKEAVRDLAGLPTGADDIPNDITK